MVEIRMLVGWNRICIQLSQLLLLTTKYRAVWKAQQITIFCHAGVKKCQALEGNVKGAVRIGSQFCCFFVTHARLALAVHLRGRIEDAFSIFSKLNETQFNNCLIKNECMRACHIVLYSFLLRELG